MALNEPELRMALVGGGPGSFIGPVHRIAAQLAQGIRLVAGVFSTDIAKSTATGRLLGLDPQRVYSSHQQMFEQERQRPDGLDFVAIATPNHLHYPVAQSALEAGFHVLSDKPATATLDEALALRDVVRRAKRLYGLTYTNTGYPLVREARKRCLRGDLGPIRKAVVEYYQGWLAEKVEDTGSKQASWRTDPAQAGLGGCIGDIGVHAFNLLEFVTGRRVTQVAADLSRVVPGRNLDDDCNVLLRLDNGAAGVLHASQIAAGEGNFLRLRVYGARGGLAWRQEDPHRLYLNWLDRPSEVVHQSSGGMGDAKQITSAEVLPVALPEGYLEAFGAVYRDFADAIRAMKADPTAYVASALVPDIEEGVRSMAFVKAAVDSSRERAGWVSVPD